ncbi:hypothetical protein SERLA73DRAFT_175022 [Serpula lacrymans var. lacrymans S7.3]|uniref:Uncharacterized protein n=2 Tax=Serpula lacrymans var. lacrymans TaxID=341189 RepID=F8PK58_SERL3|nr:uncharacterized protein SERLADRAFT_456800 [Serpula lacrymans var. lacrymans S7.9]EGO03512.1 hypothetical protein SERLA73DRAFT_175022 [Serpula lacrymans var. lacrymans S7.3]EGO29262.1 hypothetical protein SERLADRAFT_456800 [Serpula lacrymans var. lacrymans S7.9]
MVFNHDANDPLAIVDAPPPNETPHEKSAREEREAEAKRISDLIDENIKAERAELKKEKDVVKVLLLGQSESGKSTTLKNFRMKYAQEEWIEERTSWQAVIQLNIVRSINVILDALCGDPAENEEGSLTTKVTDQHILLKSRLEPLRVVEKDLKRLLGTSAEEIVDASSDEQQATPFEGPVSDTLTRHKRSGEFFVRSWRTLLHVPYGDNRNGRILGDTPDTCDVTEIIASCKDDMKALWQDDAVQTELARGRIRLDDSAGFFLNDLDRLTVQDYEPTDDDVLRARLRTSGIQEYTLHFDTVSYEGARTWKMFDVGGSRTMRHAWLPYFEGIDAVIFLAPVSCFNEKLAEDRRINRLEDSFILWKSICSSRLLARTALIIFLNKCDILEEKINRGIMVNKYLQSYGDRPNEYSAVIKYLRQKFKESMMQHSPEPRVFYAYATVVTETKATAMTLKSVRDGILREHLKQADFV